MSSASIIKVKESIPEIKKLMKHSHPMISKRLHALLLIKEHEASGISKRAIADAIGVDHNSVQTWRTVYTKGGIKALMSHSKLGFKPSVITKLQEEALGIQLHKADNGIVGFVELLEWFNTTFGTEVNYKTFYGFVIRKFGAKIKTARKVHIKKDEEAVAAFKKTSVTTANQSSKQKRKVTGR
jgi:transposase